MDESARTRRVSSGKLRDAALLAIEGLHALDGKLESVDTLYAAGFRMMGLTHFFDNEVAASAHGVMRTAFGTRGLAAITDGLLTAGMDQETIARVMGGNTRDFL